MRICAGTLIVIAGHARKRFRLRPSRRASRHSISGPAIGKSGILSQLLFQEVVTAGFPTNWPRMDVVCQSSWAEQWGSSKGELMPSRDGARDAPMSVI